MDKVTSRMIGDGDDDNEYKRATEVPSRSVRNTSRTKYDEKRGLLVNCRVLKVGGSIALD